MFGKSGEEAERNWQICMVFQRATATPFWRDLIAKRSKLTINALQGRLPRQALTLQVLTSI